MRTWSIECTDGGQFNHQKDKKWATPIGWDATIIELQKLGFNAYRPNMIDLNVIWNKDAYERSDFDVFGEGLFGDILVFAAGEIAGAPWWFNAFVAVFDRGRSVMNDPVPSGTYDGVKITISYYEVSKFSGCTYVVEEYSLIVAHRATDGAPYLYDPGNIFVGGHAYEIP